MARIILIGAPLDDGQPQQGCVMGPAAFRIAGLGKTLATLGHQVEDRGDVTPAPADPAHVSDNPAIRCLPQVIAWTQALADAAESAMAEGMPIFLGGDHAMSLGSLAGVARHADRVGRPLFILWLDAHSDFHNLRTTQSGNLHGTSLGYAAGLSGFLPFPPFPAPVPTGNICLFGIRSLDPAEQQFLTASDVIVNDMRVLDERGVVAPLREFLGLVARAGGLLHVSLDVDFLDPAIAPAVGTTVPGGATLREAHLVMEMLHESGLVTSLDLAELNPFLDERGRTARLMVDLAASLMGRKVFDRPTAPML